jgi:preprotein translocase subunit SecG
MDWIAVIQIILSVALIVLILMQRNDASVGSAFGSDSGGPERTRRGAERMIFQATIVIAIVFVALSLVSLLQ